MTKPEQDPDREALARAWDAGYYTAWRRSRGLLREDESPLNPYREPMREATVETCLADAEGRPGICHEVLPCPHHSTPESGKARKATK